MHSHPVFPALLVLSPPFAVQDLQKVTPWGIVTVRMDEGSYQGPAHTHRLRSRALRSDVLSAPRSTVARVGAIGSRVTYPKPKGWDGSFDRDMTSSASVTGVPGTYNHLTDALLDLEPTRAMYLRRLRTLTDELLLSGRIAQVLRPAAAGGQGWSLMG